MGKKPTVPLSGRVNVKTRQQASHLFRAHFKVSEVQNRSRYIFPFRYHSTKKHSNSQQWYLEKRLQQNQSGFHKDSYTYKRRPVALAFQASFTDINHAIEKEKQIKKWSKVKKKALIDGSFELLPDLAKKKFD